MPSSLPSPAMNGPMRTLGPDEEKKVYEREYERSIRAAASLAVVVAVWSLLEQAPVLATCRLSSLSILVTSHNNFTDWTAFWSIAWRRRRSDTFTFLLLSFLQLLLLLHLSRHRCVEVMKSIWLHQSSMREITALFLPPLSLNVSKLPTLQPSALTANETLRWALRVLLFKRLCSLSPESERSTCGQGARVLNLRHSLSLSLRRHAICLGKCWQFDVPDVRCYHFFFFCSKDVKTTTDFRTVTTFPKINQMRH